MRLWLVAGACILYLSLPVALGLKCYYCSSSKSWDDCQPETSQTCPAGFDKCAKRYMKTPGLESFRKYCISSSGCTKDKFNCENADGSMECEMNCCDTDNCNPGSAFRISGILLLTCALASLMIVVKA